MSNQFVRYAFAAGEVTPKLLGRSDLEKYDFGCEIALNWIVDYEGGITCRQGMLVGDYIMHPDKPYRMFPFQFAADEPNTYVLLFGDEYVRFIQDGGYVLEDELTITGITQANPGVVTSNAHGLSSGDWGYITDIPSGMTELSGKLVVVGATTLNTFALIDVFGNPLDTSSFSAYTVGGKFSRIYTVVSPFAGEDLDELVASQVRDTVRLTHKNYRPRDLTRNDHTDWTIGLTVFGNEVPIPTGVVATASDMATSPPGASVAYAVTAVDRDGNESSQSDRGLLIDASNILVNPVTYYVDWDYAEDVAYWNVYRSQIQAHSSIPPGRGEELGYVGRAYSPHFADQNIIADYTKTPPVNKKPFANREIVAINVLTGGSGYDDGDPITVTSGTGTGFSGYIIAQSGLSSGAILGVIIESGGEGYLDTDTVNVSGGSGATFEIVIGEKRTNNPRVSAIFQQRQLYAATIAKPMTVFGSKPGMFKNFDTAHIVLDSDSYQLEVDASIVSPIRFLIPLRDSLLVLASTGIWILTGENGQALTPKNALAEPQAYTGCLSVQPVRIGNDILYIEEHACAARLLTYKDQSKAYQGEDISLLSSHLFSPDNEIQSMAYNGAPRKVLWAQRKDGTALAFTILRDQNIYAWTRIETPGTIKNMVAINEHRVDQVYFAVEREINGNTVAFFEYLAPHTAAQLEDRVHLDCAIQLTYNYPVGRIQPHGTTGEISITSDVNSFSPFYLGHIWRGGGGKGVVSDYTSAKRITVTLERDITSLVPQTSDAAYIEEGDWSIDPLVTVVHGLEHLEGKHVWYLADGWVGQAEVLNGSITLDQPASRVTVGLHYQCKLKPVPTSSPQVPLDAQKKRVVLLAVNELEARGLKHGPNFDNMDELRERTDEPMGTATRLQTGIAVAEFRSEWGLDGAVCILQDQPLPATIRGLVIDMEVDGLR